MTALPATSWSRSSETFIPPELEGEGSIYSESSVFTYRSKWRNIPPDLILQHLCERTKSRIATVEYTRKIPNEIHSYIS
jgi:hypothetical protein